MSQEPFNGWAILELMGHRRLAGLVEDVEMFGGRMLRLDVYPGDAAEPITTQFYGCAAVYCLTPTTEEIARKVALREVPRPVQQFELTPPTQTWVPPRDAREDACDACGHARRWHVGENGACTEPSCHDEDGEACPEFAENLPF